MRFEIDVTIQGCYLNVQYCHIMWWPSNETNKSHLKIMHFQKEKGSTSHEKLNYKAMLLNDTCSILLQLYSPSIPIAEE